MSLSHLLNWIPNKREVLARLTTRLGVFSLLDRLAMLRRPMFVVLTYHRIAVPGSQAGPFYDPVISATPESFKAQIHHLARRYRIIGLDQIQEIKVAGARYIKDMNVLITFDDGYRDNFDSAFPILRGLGVPATFFIPTGVLNCPRLPWWDHVACTLKKTRVPRFKLDRYLGDPQAMIIELGVNPDVEQRTTAIKRIVGQFLDRAIPDEAWFLAQLDQQAEVTVNSMTLGCDLFMDWKQVRQLADAGMAIGSHSYSHRALGELDDDEQRRELVESKRILESQLCRRVTALSYPFGWERAFTARTVELAAETGYQLAFSAIEGVNQPTKCTFHPLILRRLTIGTGDSPFLLRARTSLYGAFGMSLL